MSEANSCTVKYKLRLTIRIISARKVHHFTRDFIWENKKDAVDCMVLLKKAKISRDIGYEFVEFTDPMERSLEENSREVIK